MSNEKVRLIIEIDKKVYEHVRDKKFFISPWVDDAIAQGIQYNLPFNFDEFYEKVYNCTIRPKGTWVFDGCDDVTCKCMFCGHEHVYVTSPKADGVNFCEQCGADMRGGNDG